MKRESLSAINHYLLGFSDVFSKRLIFDNSSSLSSFTRHNNSTLVKMIAQRIVFEIVTATSMGSKIN